jgi:hypothetical protein
VKKVAPVNGGDAYDDLPSVDYFLERIMNRSTEDLLAKREADCCVVRLLFRTCDHCGG